MDFGAIHQNILGKTKSMLADDFLHIFRGKLGGINLAFLFLPKDLVDDRLNSFVEVSETHYFHELISALSGHGVAAEERGVVFAFSYLDSI